MSDISLEKLDLIRERTGLSYKDAKDLLKKYNGDILEALISWEEEKPTTKDTVNDLIGKLKDAFKDGQGKATPHVEAAMKFLKEKYSELQLDERIETVKGEANKHATFAIDKAKQLISEGKVSKVCIKHEGKMLVEIPVASWGAGAAVAAAVLMPELAVIAVLAKVFKLIEVEIVKIDGTTEKLSISNDETK
ncbi:MAG: DUF4342 domain-containing protein [Negativicutes bacterium]|jgi:hypothetical protein